MLGVLDMISTGPSEPRRRTAALLRATGSFRSAIAADERNADAKFNLEVALRLLREINTDTVTLRGFGGTATQGQEFGSGY